MTSSFFYEFENIYNLRNLDNQIIVCTEMNAGLANQVRMEFCRNIVFLLNMAILDGTQTRLLDISCC